MVERLFLHIGTHKTGTTSIQASLADAHDRLLSHGVLYPRTGRGAFSGHPNFAWKVLGRARHDADLGGIDELVDEVEATQPHTVIISSEALSDRPRDPALAMFGREVARRLHAEAVSILAYVRPQEDYLESHYVQLVRGGNSSQSLEQHVRTHLDHPRFDYLQVFSPWHDAFPSDLHVRPYVQDVVADFWKAVEGLPDHPHRTGRRNVRIGRRGVEMLRVLRRTLENDGAQPGPDLRRNIMTAANEIMRAYPDDPPYREMTPELRTLIREHFRSANERFATHLVGVPRERVLPESADMLPAAPWTLDDATPDEQRFFEHLVAHARDGIRASAPSTGTRRSSQQ